MAITLQKTTSINIGVIVDNAITAIKAVRSQDQSAKESAFQEAVADGLSYEGQIEFREKQLADEKASGFSDPVYQANLKESLASTKRLSRFYNYRLKYQEALGELNAGNTNAVEYAKTLEKLLDGTDDPDLKAEIQGNLTSAETLATQYKNTVLSNQVKLAQYDGTEKELNAVIKKVKKAKAMAEINGNEDEVESYNLTIASLNSQKVQTKAENVVNDIAISGMLGTSNSTSKLKTLNTQISDADTSTAITIDGKRYDSEQQYWEITRNAYLSGNGSGIFADYFSDLETQYANTIAGETARYGFVQPSTIQKINSELTTLRSKPEMAPFIDRIDSFRATTVANAVKTVADTVIDRATYTGDFVQADTTLKGLGTTYQVDTTGYQLQLGTVLNQQVNASIEAGQGVPAEANLLPASEFSVPKVSTEVAPQNSSQNVVTDPSSTTKPDYTVVAGDNLSSVAARNGLSLNQLLDLNPEYKANPNAVSVGATIKVATPKPVTAEVVPTAVTKPLETTVQAPEKTQTMAQTKTDTQQKTETQTTSAPKVTATTSQLKTLSDAAKKLKQLQAQVDLLAAREQSSKIKT